MYHMTQFVESNNDLFVAFVNSTEMPLETLYQEVKDELPGSAPEAPDHVNQGDADLPVATPSTPLQTLQMRLPVHVIHVQQ